VNSNTEATRYRDHPVAVCDKKTKQNKNKNARMKEFSFPSHSPDNFGEDEGLDVDWWLLFLSFFTAVVAALVGRLDVMWLILRLKELLDLEGTPVELDFFSSSHAAKMFRATCPLTHRSR